MKLDASNRINRRFFLIEGKWSDIEKVLLDYLGILGWAKAAPLLVSEDKNSSVIAVSRKSVDDIRAAFELAENELKIKMVSGTLKGLHEKKV